MKKQHFLRGEAVIPKIYGFARGRKVSFELNPVAKLVSPYLWILFELEF